MHLILRVTLIRDVNHGLSAFRLQLRISLYRELICLCQGIDFLARGRRVHRFAYLSSSLVFVNFFVRDWKARGALKLSLNR